jgi:hypothetical protein
MTIVQTLERAAISAHNRGIRFADFYEANRETIKNAVARDRFNALYRRLLSIVVSGDAANIEELSGDDPEPWLADDAASKPDDVATSARWQG